MLCCTHTLTLPSRHITDLIILAPVINVLGNLFQEASTSTSNVSNYPSTYMFLSISRGIVVDRCILQHRLKEMNISRVGIHGLATA